MKKILCLIAAAVALPMALHAETWKNAALMDSMCAAKADAKANPDAHPRPAPSSARRADTAS